MKLLDDLLVFLRDDFNKYKTRISPEKLNETFNSVAFLAGGKFMYTHAADAAPIVGYKDALELLCKANLVHRICHTSARGLPLAARKDGKKFKVIPLDSGIYRRLLQLDKCHPQQGLVIQTRDGTHSSFALFSQ